MMETTQNISGVCISTISVEVALAIGVTELFNQVRKFAAEGDSNDCTSFTHYNFFYSHPEFDKKWPGEKQSEFHQVHTCCHICKARPERNHAGIGTLYLLNNGVGEREIWQTKAWKTYRGQKLPVNDLVPNTPRLSRMILLCKKHTACYFIWREKKPVGMQLKLF